MARRDDSYPAVAVTNVLADVLGPLDLAGVPIRAITITNVGAAALTTGQQLLTGPTAAGPWFAETVTGLSGLAAAASCRFEVTSANRFMKLKASTAAGTTTLSVIVQAEG